MMSESNKNKLKEFESRFRLVSEEKVFEYNPSDWTALEALLDKEERNIGPLPAILTGLGLIVILFLGYNSFTNQDNTTSATISQTNIIDSSTTDDKGDDRGNTNEQIGILETTPIKVKEQAEEANEIGLKNQQKITVESNAGLIIAQDMNNKETSKGEKRAPSALLLQDDLTEKGNDVYGSISLTDQNNATARQTEMVKESTPAVNDKKQVQLPPSISNEQEEWVASVMPLAALESRLNVIVASKRTPIEFGDFVDVDNNADLLRSRFIISGNIGVEVAQTPLGDRSDTDYNFGLRLGFAASSKLVLTAGLNYIQECYSAEAKDYTPPMGFWSSTNGVAPDQIQAVCNMLDFSFGTSYHFTDISRNGLVAHLNVSSNYMVREEYTYLFSNSDDDWIGTFGSGNQTLLSNIELGASYKFNIGDNLFLDAGPYVKLPTSGVGHGNVKLRAYGFRLGMSLVK